MKIRIGLLNVLTLKENEPELRVDMLLEKYPYFDISSGYIEDQYEGIHDEETERKAVPKIVRLGKEMEEDGVLAIIVNCASDPGVPELRQAVRIPVIGAGSAAACVALSLGYRIATLGIREDAPKIVKRILGDRLVAAIRPDGVTTAVDLRTDAGRAASIDTICRFEELDIDVICLACTGYSVFGIASEIERKAGLPVVDALEAAGLIAWYRTANTPVK